MQNNTPDNFLFVPIHNKLVVSVDVQNVVKLNNEKLMLLVYYLKLPIPPL